MKRKIEFIKSLLNNKSCRDKTEKVDSGRRKMLAITGAVVASATIKAEESHLNNAWAYIEDKKAVTRRTPIVPFGAISISNYTKHCTACQRCVEACPQKILRLSSNLATLMMPEMSFEHGFCPPNCTRCTDVCSEGAIKPVTPAEKSSLQIGHAVWIKKNCIAVADDKACDICARKCPTGAITMAKAESMGGKEIPMVNTAHCIGCGACEYSCPAQPFCAIYVEGNEIHHTI
jgi:ferredoxin